MKKFVVIMVLGLALLLMGLTLSASAVTISAPWSPDGGGGSGELNLYQIFNNANFAGSSYANNAAFNGALPAILATLPTSDATFNYSYKVTGYYATFAGFTQTPGWYLKDTPGTSGSFGFTANADGIIVVPGSPIAITATGEFGFYDLTNNLGAGTKYTQLSLNSGSPSQSNGLIFDLGTGQFIIAFEDGSSSQPLGDNDYNDLVLKVTVTATPIPLPPSALLLGSGLLGLVGLRRWRKNA
jgi:hypothetical protein